MGDETHRALERKAHETGALEDQRASLCYSIGRLSIEIDLQPSLMRKVGKGSYDGQALWHDEKVGVTHPCVRWKTDNEEQFWDLASEECVWKRSTSMVTMGLFTGGYTHAETSGYHDTLIAGEPGLIAALQEAGLEEHYQVNPAGETPFGSSLYNIPVIESPFIQPDQMLLIQPHAPSALFQREYPACFDSHEPDREQGDDDAEDAEG